MNYEILKKVKNQLSERHTIADEQREYDTLKAMSNPICKNAEHDLRAATLALSKLLSQGADTAEAEKKVQAAKSNLDKALHDNGVKNNYYTCIKCQDTGQLPNGRYCTCLLDLYTEYERQSKDYIQLPPYTFADNDIDNIDCKQSKILSKYYQAVHNYCNAFPDTTVQNILITGNVGTGKSRLMSAIANDIYAKGYQVKYLTAFDLNQQLLDYHLDRKNANNLNAIISCDLLLIDDLGTEQIYKNVTAEYLYYILEKRNQKHTIISTNLTASTIKERYYERVYSRLYDEKYAKFTLVGDDLRLIKR